jgi:hypothetical protein
MRTHTDEHDLVRRCVRSLRSLGVFDLLVCGFIVAGLALRLWRLDVMEFKRDEFRDILNAYRAAQTPWSAPLLIGEGTTLSPGIFFYQLLAIPVSVTRDPVSITRFIALLNVAAIPGLFLVLRQVFASRVALWATALFATAPWMIVFSRKIWNPDVLVPFLFVTLLLLVSVMRRYARWKVFAFAFFLALLTQLHLSVWLALVPLVPLGFLSRPWRRPFDLVAGAAVFLAVYLLTLGPRTGEFIAAFPGSSTQRPDAHVVRLAGHNGLESVRVSSGSGFEFLLGTGGYAAFAKRPGVRWALAGFLLYGGLAVAGFVYAIGRVARLARGSSRHLPDVFLLMLLLMACSLQAFYLVFRIYSPPHYFVVVSLLPPLVVALFLAWSVDRFGSVGPLLARVLLVIVLMANVFFGSAFLEFINASPGSIDGDYGQPYFVERERWKTELAHAVRRLNDQARELAASPSPVPEEIRSRYEVAFVGANGTWYVRRHPGLPSADG